MWEFSHQETRLKHDLERYFFPHLCSYWCVSRREWMGMGEWGNGIIINIHYGSFPHSLRLAPVLISKKVKKTWDCLQTHVLWSTHCLRFAFHHLQITFYQSHRQINRQIDKLIDTNLCIYRYVYIYDIYDIYIYI